jgi:hypothetical protein
MSHGKLTSEEFAVLLSALDTAKQCWMTDLRKAAKDEDTVLGSEVSFNIESLKKIESHLWANKHVL